MNTTIKRYLGVGLVLAVIAAGSIFWYWKTQTTHTPSEEVLIRTTVTSFGDHLQEVSLLGPAAEVKKEMDAQYSYFIQPDLLAKWEANPKTAPGKLTSSPWPDRIDIESVKKNADGTYTVEAFIVMVANGPNSTTTRTLNKVVFTLSLGPDGWQITGYDNTPD